MKIKRMILVAGLIVVFCLSALPAAALETVPVQDSLRVQSVRFGCIGNPRGTYGGYRTCYGNNLRKFAGIYRKSACAKWNDRCGDC